MKYIVNGDEVGKDSDKQYEYDAVGDKWIEAGKSSPHQPSYSKEVNDEIKKYEDEQKEVERIEKSIERKKEQKEVENYLFDQKQQQHREELEKRQEEDENKRVKAYNEAWRRYHKLSFFAKLFTKKPDKYNWRNMDPENIDNLYKKKSR